MPVRDDYILRFFNQLREAIAESLKLRELGQHEPALVILLQAQEKLFLRPATQFLTLSLDEQLALLERGESPANARLKWIGYASLLRAAGEVYEKRDRADLAAGAFQLALQTLLTIGVKFGPLEDEKLAEARFLLSRIPPDDLKPTVLEMLPEQLAGEIRSDPSA